MSIRSELEKIILTWAATQSIPVSIENIPFNKPNNSKYVEVYFLGSSTICPTVNGKRERETGIMQVNCCVPQGNGAKAGEDLADAIKALFPVVPKVGTVSIERPANISQALYRDDGFRVIPVRVSYRAERSL